MSQKNQPAYALTALKATVKAGEFVVTRRVQRYLAHKGFPPDSPARYIAILAESDFHKSLAHREREGVQLDVYRPVILGERWYLKIVMHEDKRRVVILSCCRDGEAH